MMIFELSSCSVGGICLWREETERLSRLAKELKCGFHMLSRVIYVLLGVLAIQEFRG
jgi:hypothetical protein